MKKLICEDKNKGLFEHTGFKKITGMLSALFLILNIYSIIQGKFSIILLELLGGIYLFLILILLFYLLVQIRSYSNKVKLYNDGISLRTSKNFFNRFLQIGLDNMFFNFNEIDNISVAPIYHEIGLLSKGGFSISGAQSLILYAKNGKKYVSWLIDKEGFQEAIKNVKFDKIKFKKLPQIVI